MHVRFRFPAIAACLMALALVPAALAQDKATPTVTLRLKSIDGILHDAKFLAKEIGKENEASQFEQLIQSQIGPKGLFGIDTKRPLGLYAKVTANLQESAGVLLVPIVDQEALLKQLEAFGIQPTKEKDGTYSLNLPGVPVPVFFKFANSYLYLTALSKDPITSDKALQPAQVLPDSNKALFSAVVNVDQLPDSLRKTFLKEFDGAIQKEKDKKQPGETEMQRKVRLQVFDEFARQARAAVQEGKRLELNVNVDQQAKQLSTESSFSAVSGSKLAASIAELGQSRSLFAGLMKPDAAWDVLVHLTLPDAVRQALEPVIDEEVRKDVEKEKDAAKRALAQQFLEAIKPSLKSGELDALVHLGGPEKDGVYDVLVGAKIKDGGKVAEALRSVFNALPPEQKALIQFDAEKAGDMSIHRLNVQALYDAKAKKFLGDNPLYIGVQPTAVLASGGPKGLELLKSASTLKAQPAPQFAMNMSMGKLAGLLAQGDNKKRAATEAAAQKIFTEGANSKDQVRVSVQGGKELRGRMVMDTQVLRFLAVVGEASKK